MKAYWGVNCPAGKAHGATLPKGAGYVRAGHVINPRKIKILREPARWSTTIGETRIVLVGERRHVTNASLKALADKFNN